MPPCALSYRGQRHLDGGTTCVVVFDLFGEVVEPLVHEVFHSPTGLEWGYAGSGPSDLARSILADVFGAVPHPSIYQRFKADFVVTWKGDGWSISREDILRWWTELSTSLGVTCPICAGHGGCTCR